MRNNTQQFPKIKEYLNNQYSSHHIDDIVYDAANRLLEYFNSNKEFCVFNNPLNSQEDIRRMFDDITDEWLSDNYLEITSDDQNAMMEYNILTDSDINRVIKDDIFRILWSSNKL